MGQPKLCLECNRNPVVENTAFCAQHQPKPDDKGDIRRMGGTGSLTQDIPSGAADFVRDILGGKKR